MALYGLLAASLVGRALATPSVDIAYCASVYTGSNSGNNSIYQSDGLCYDFCFDDYAYAVVSGTECFCSDYTPASDSRVTTSECNAACAGYPSDWCAGDGLYAYMALSKAPAGTAAASDAASDTSSTKPASTSTRTSSSSTPTPPAPTTSTSTSTPTSSTSVSTSSTSTTLSTSTTTPATPTVQTVTAPGGGVQTVTVTPSASATAAASSSSKSVSTGAAVGIAVGVVGAAIVAAVAAFLVWRRKRREREEIVAEHNSKANSPRGTSPNTSSPKVSEASAALFDQSGRRRSALMPIDPRVDPALGGIYGRTGENKSRDSVNSLRDDHDYSRRVHQPNRVLRATNPDPE